MQRNAQSIKQRKNTRHTIFIARSEFRRQKLSLSQFVFPFLYTNFGVPGALALASSIEGAKSCALEDEKGGLKNGGPVGVR
jgi:hypothetical protein